MAVVTSLVVGVLLNLLYSINLNYHVKFGKEIVIIVVRILVAIQTTGTNLV